MSGHTPGPWEAKWSKYTEGKFIVQAAHPSNRVIASFDDDGDGAGVQSIATAYLIAAAPDLLKVAQDAAAIGLHVWPDGECKCSQCDLVRTASAAIAKATQEADHADL